MRGHAAARQRWLTSFADLCLLLVGFFVLLHARAIDPERLAGGIRAGFGGSAIAATPPLDLPARALFVPGEAILLPEAAIRFRQRAAAAAAAGERATVTGAGTEPGGARLDRWELAAARTAAVARALRAGGLAEARIDIAVTAPRQPGQRLTVTFAR